MQDRLKAIWNRIKEFWAKFNKKQKILFISIFVVIIVVIIVLAKIVGHKDKIKLRSCENEKEAVEVRALLNDEGFKVTIDEDYNIYVSEDDYLEAK